MASTELVAALEGLVSEVDRLLFIGEAGRRQRGLRALSVEALRYLRAGAAQVVAGEAGAETLRGVARTVAEACAPDAPIVELANRVESLLQPG
jgi:hypothetical protein